MLLLIKLMEAKAYFDGSFIEEFWKEYLEYIKHDVDLNYQKMLQIFGKMQAIFVVFDRNQIPDSLVVRNHIVQEKMLSQVEIYLINQDLFVEWLYENVTKICLICLGIFGIADIIGIHFSNYRKIFVLRLVLA